MVAAYNPPLRSRMRSERVLRMLPLNVVMAARIRGEVDPERLSKVLDRLRLRHALLAVRVEVDANDVAWYRTDEVPEFIVRVRPRTADDAWIDAAEEEFMASFPLETGPLVRFVLVHSTERSELVICAHHLVCDGKSLALLIRDLMRHLAAPDQEVEVLPPPPPIDDTTVPAPLRPNFIAGKILGLLNRKWAATGRRFGADDLTGLHRAYWEKNRGLRLMAWELSEAETSALASRCRDEKITVNSAVWTAFLAAQSQVQKSLESYHHRAGMAVSTRDKLAAPVGEVFGFYASSLTVRLRYDPRQGFWEQARRLHAIINKCIDQTDPFRMLIAEHLNPSLLDSLYFSKYDLLDSRISRMLLKKMGWHDLTLGYAITNVGKMDIPTSYGPLNLESVWGPSVYSDVEEKIVGVITVGGKISFMMTYEESVLGEDTARRLKPRAMEYLTSPQKGPGH